MSTDPERDAVIDAMLPNVPFDGWTLKSVRAALSALDQHPDDAPLMFPGGPGEMIEAFCSLADERMEQTASATNLSDLNTAARIHAIIATRLEQNRPHREAIRRALSWLAIPTNTPLALRITANTVNAIWHTAGDTAADTSWYTKRATLAAIYTPTLLYWLHNPADDNTETLAFLDRRLTNARQLGKLRARFGFGGLGRFRK